MGQALVAALGETPAARLAGGVDIDGDLPGLAAVAVVLIDFSTPAALAQTLEGACQARRPLVVGTTGLEPTHQGAIDAAAHVIPILQSANMSVGVAVLAMLARVAAQRLGTEWDIEICEMHHRHKRDAPSGTALMLGMAAADGRNETLDSVRVALRDGSSEPRQPGSIGFASLRGGSVPGDHSVIFAADDERLELTHRAQSRMIFARGAIKAALWLKDQPPGRYGLDDMLSLR